MPTFYFGGWAEFLCYENAVVKVCLSLDTKTTWLELRKIPGFVIKKISIRHIKNNLLYPLQTRLANVPMVAKIPIFLPQTYLENIPMVGFYRIID